jgi:hypothetical protein
MFCSFKWKNFDRMLGNCVDSLSKCHVSLTSLGEGNALKITDHFRLNAFLHPLN